MSTTALAPFLRLVEAFQKLPGVGPKSAQRLAFYVLKQPSHYAHEFAMALAEARSQLKSCEQCFHLTTEALCDICQNPNRNATQLCIVAEVRDLFALERIHTFQGRYHVLGGLISPVDGIGPDQLHIAELCQRADVLQGTVQELILALPPSIEGDTTSLYVSQQLRHVVPAGVHIRLSRIAFGLPVGGELDYADQLTLTRALAGRQQMA